jgi:hypothetical protein
MKIAMTDSSNKSYGVVPRNGNVVELCMYIHCGCTRPFAQTWSKVTLGAAPRLADKSLNSAKIVQVGTQLQ